MAEPEYVHSNLKEPSSFRPLEVTPGSDILDCIYCTIDEFDRRSAQCPPNTALSYAWGDVNTMVPITLNGLPAFVTKNLDEALLYLRHTRPQILFWIDALSINQKDDSERAHQVSQMREMYSEASKVISWLGPGYLVTDRLFWFIKTHYENCTLTGGLPENCTFLANRELADAITCLEEQHYRNRI